MARASSCSLLRQASAMLMAATPSTTITCMALCDSLCHRTYSSADHSAVELPEPPTTNHQDAHSQDTIDFGYTTVPRQQKQQLVGQVFSSVASSYDVMNDLMSAGLHRLWKDHLVTTLAPGPGQQHLDVAGGTGDVAFRVLRAIRLAEASGVGGGTGGRMRGGPGGMMEHAGQHAGQRKRGSVTVFDINADMLAEGQRRAAAQGLDRQEGDLVWVEGNAECLPFEEGCVDSYTVAFGIRNVTNRDAALKEAFRVLKPGGRFLCLEFSHVTLPGLQQVYDAYSHLVIPQIGRLVAGDEASYRYLVESIRTFPDADTFADMVHDAGFSGVDYTTLTGGVVAIHSGYKL